ncbi:MAG TPA: hypothetical protein VEY11_11140 [Pyrinomonadaceae bacterium]|nr:hypothetical protein [Pyrinomonadaceae bacterium]
MNKLRPSQIFGSLLISLCALPVLAQTSEKPIIVRRVKPEIAHDARLVSAIISALGAIELNGVRYHYNKVDLNGDGRPEVLVFIFGRTMCGTSGCDAMVFQSLGRSGYKLITHFGPARNPIIVSGRRSHGWNDLIMPVAGGGIRPGYYAVLRFNGKTYPENPTVEPARSLGRRVKGTAYVVGSYAPDAGTALRPGRKNKSVMSLNR